MAATQLNNCDFNKFKRVFVNALVDMNTKCNADIRVTDEALNYIESLCFKLITLLLSPPTPQHINELEDKIVKVFPSPLDKWVLNEAMVQKRKPLCFPTDKLHSLIQKEILHNKTDFQLTQMICFIVEFIAFDVLRLAGGFVINCKHQMITEQDVRVAMCAAHHLVKLFNDYEDDEDNDDDDVNEIMDDDNSSTEQSYDDLVKEFILKEKQFVKQLNLIMKLFRDPIVNVTHDVEPIFGNLNDIYELSQVIIASLEDSLEISQQQQGEDDGSPNNLIGYIFEDLTEQQEFDVYEQFIHFVTHSSSSTQSHSSQSSSFHNQITQLYHLVTSSPLMTSCSSSHFIPSLLSYKYLLPKLLLIPLIHVHQYFEYLNLLKDKSTSKEDSELIEQAIGMLSSLKIHLSSFKSQFSKANQLMITSSNMKLKQTKCKLKELGFHQLNGQQSIGKFICEGTMCVSQGKRVTERHTFLFEHQIVMAKSVSSSSNHTSNVNNQIRRMSSSLSSSQSHYSSHSFDSTTSSLQWKIKEKLLLKDIELCDLNECSFELVSPSQCTMQITLKSHEEKCFWLANLLMAQYKQQFERELDLRIQQEDKKFKFHLPKQYKFSEKDKQNENIIFECAFEPNLHQNDHSDNNNQSDGHHQMTTNQIPIIKGAILNKLIERLTFHQYADPMFVRVFLTTFRSFCTPQQLLDLLIDRFNIPELTFDRSECEGEECEEECAELWKDENYRREIIKKFKKQFVQPVQFRVLNVLRHWIDHHFYDFERDSQLLMQLIHFLDDKIKYKTMKKWIESIKKIVERKQQQLNDVTNLMFNSSPPQIEWWLTREQDKFDWLTLHPIELARQLTLLEFDLYKAVKPSELVGTSNGESLVWTKKDKQKSSPNLMKMIHFSSKFVFSLERSIIECDNLEERIAVVQRIIEVLCVLFELNNFNGVLEVISALNSAAVYRLEHTFNGVFKSTQSSLLKRVYEECKELSEDHFKKYQEKLRSINPPCVPFLGIYLTNILHIEEGNQDYLNGNGNLINFSKRRKVAEITNEIQQFQNQSYNLSVQSNIRSFLTSLNPFKNPDGSDTEFEEKELNDYLYARSLVIEPRGCKSAGKFPRRWPELTLKSPGIKLKKSFQHSLTPLTLLKAKTSSSQSKEKPSIDLVNSQSKDESQSDLSDSQTINSPATPLTPPNCMKQNENCIFAQVIIGRDTPPPLPPRIKRNSSHLNTIHESPPPLPPRSFTFTSSSSSSSSSSQPLRSPPSLPPKTHLIKSKLN